MSSFADAIKVIMRHEGGWTPDDTGGPTSYGITLPVLREAGGDLDHDGDIDAADIRLLTEATAAAIYRAQWWDRYRYWMISDQHVATKVFDISVNCGPRTAHRMLQEALGDVGRPVRVDGILGIVTASATNTVDPERLVSALRKRQTHYYHDIANKHPRLRVNLAGWLNRATY